jgi:hypothetical protein
MAKAESPKRVTVVIGATLALAALAVGSFVGARVLSQPGVPVDEKALEALEQDSAKPRFAGTVNGIRLHSGIAGDQGARVGCEEPFQPVDFAATRGTPFEIEPLYLPPGIVGETSGPAATACAGMIVGSGRFWAPSVAGNPWISIQRTLRPSAWAYSEAPGERVSAGRVQGKPAVFIQPVLPDGRGNSAIIFADAVGEGFVVTVISGSEVRFDELLKVAEGVIR